MSVDWLRSRADVCARSSVCVRECWLANVYVFIGDCYHFSPFISHVVFFSVESFVSGNWCFDCRCCCFCHFNRPTLNRWLKRKEEKKRRNRCRDRDKSLINIITRSKRATAAARDQISTHRTETETEIAWRKKKRKENTARSTKKCKIKVVHGDLYTIR